MHTTGRFSPTGRTRSASLSEVERGRDPPSSEHIFRIDSCVLYRFTDTDAHISSRLSCIQTHNLSRSESGSDASTMSLEPYTDPGALVRTPPMHRIWRFSSTWRKKGDHATGHGAHKHSTRTDPCAHAPMHASSRNANIPVCDAAPVLHGPRRELGHRHHVQLGQRVRDPKVVVVEIERLSNVCMCGGAVGMRPRHRHCDTQACQTLQTQSP